MSSRLTNIIFEAGVKEGLGFSRSFSERLARTLQSEMINDIRTQGRLSLKGFGTFRLVTRKARTGRNPSNGETLQIPQKDTITFKVSSSLKKDLN